MSDFLVIDTAKINLTIIQRSTWECTISLDFIENTDFDLRDYQIRGPIKATRLDLLPVASFDFEILSDRILKMSLSSINSSKLVKRSYRYNVELFQSSGNVDIYSAKIIEGRINVDPTI